MAGKFSIEGIFKARDKFSKPIAKMQSKLGKFTRKAGSKMRELDRINGKVAEGFKTVGKVAAGAGLAIGGALASVIKTGADFEQTLAGAATKFDVSKGTKEFEKLDKVAKHVGATTEFRSQQAAEGLQFLGQAGLTAQQATAALPGTVDLATAAQIDLAQASDVATNVLGQFGLMADDSAQLGLNLARANDAIAATTSSANTNVTELAEAMAKGGPAARDAGASIETYAALAGKLADAGIKGSEAGTQLKNTFLNLQATTPKAEKQLSKLGISVNDADGNMRDIIDVLGDFQGKMKNMGTAEQATILKDIFGKRAIGAVSNLLTVGAEDLRKYREELEAATGKSSAMAKQMRDTTTGSMKELGAAVEGVKLKIFEAVKGPFSDIVESLTKWARANKDVIASGMRDFVQFLVDNAEPLKRFATVVSILTAAWMAYAVGVKIAAGATAIFNAVMAANPITLVILAIIAAIALLIAFWPEISAFFGNIWGKVVDIFGRVKEVILSVIETIWPPVRDFFVGLFEFYIGVWSKIIDFFRPLWEPMIGLIKAGAQLVIAIWGPIKGFFIDIWDAITASLQVAFGFIMGAGKKVVSFLMKIWEPVAGFFAGIWDTIADTFNRVMGPVLDALSGVIGFFRAEGQSVLGTGEDGEDGAQSGPQVVSPEERVGRTVSEEKKTTEGKITIADETGRARTDKQPSGEGLTFDLPASGAF